MPALPLVGSRIVAPGWRLPSFSPAPLIGMAARSLIGPVGLWSSSLAHSRTSAVGDSDGSPTSGVLPSESTSEAKRAMTVSWGGGPGGAAGGGEAGHDGLLGCGAGRGGSGSAAAGDGGEDRDRVAVLDRGVQGTGEPHVLVVDVDVHEAVQLALLGDQAVLDPRVLGVDVVDQRAEGGAVALDGLVAAGVGAQDGRDPDLDGHCGRTPRAGVEGGPRAATRGCDCC